MLDKIKKFIEDKILNWVFDHFAQNNMKALSVVKLIEISTKEFREYKIVDKIMSDIFDLVKTDLVIND